MVKVVHSVTGKLGWGGAPGELHVRREKLKAGF